MLRWVVSFFVAVVFSWNVFALPPAQNSLFQRLNLDEAFLNSPVCSVKRLGGALVTEYNAVKNDPNIDEDNVTLVNNQHSEEGDHGNIVSSVISRFLPKGRTFLWITPDSLDYGSVAQQNIKNHPIFAINCSIATSIEETSKAQKNAMIKNFYQKISSLLRLRKILVVAAGNAGHSLGGKENLNTILLSNIISKLPPDLRKYIIFVGATQQIKGQEIINSRYSNNAGEFNNQFILAPSAFSAYSPQKKRQTTPYGTSFAAPVITGLLTRALLANPHLTSEDAIQLLFQTANKRNLLSTGNADLNQKIYGHGVVDARFYLQAAHTLNQLRQRHRNPQGPLAKLLQTTHLNVFRNSRNLLQITHPNVFRNSRNLKDKLDVVGLLGDYGHDTHIQRLLEKDSLNLEKYPSSQFTLDDFSSCSKIFKVRNLSDEQFKNFALSKFPLSSLSERGVSLLTQALREERTSLIDHLLQHNFNIHFRGKDAEGNWGVLPIHVAAMMGNQAYVQKLIQRGALINQQFFSPMHEVSFNPLLFTIFAAKQFPKEMNQRLKILDVLYHQGADFHQKIEGQFLVDVTEETFGVHSPLTKRVKHYANNSETIKRKPISTLASKQPPAQPKKVTLKWSLKQAIKGQKKSKHTAVQAKKKPMPCKFSAPKKKT